MINPYLLFGLLVVGAVGVAMALPRRGNNPQVLGAAVAGLAGGLLMLFLGLQAGPDKIPNLFFYVFAAVGLGGALRVITHPRPVYAALYFIMTVLASAGLFLLLSAEFMAFALIIVYAGAILITYLFVIMLATQAPEEGQEDVLADYDTRANEPVAATVIGFVLLAALTVMLFRGTGALPAPAKSNPDLLLADMPRKVDRLLETNGVMGPKDVIDRTDWNAGVVEFTTAAGAKMVLERGVGKGGTLSEVAADGTRKVVRENAWPEDLRVTNAELLGFNLLRDHPGTIEIAGVILLMAMLGAVVLSRKQVQIDEDAKKARVTQLAQADPSFDPGSESPIELVQQPASSLEEAAR
jgi:NADH-quinone oxidoreductase subunit J